MDQELMKKLKSAKSLTVQDAFLLDEALDQQAEVKSMVQDLEEEGASLAWRSQLNERLHAATPRAKPRHRWNMFRIWVPVAAGVAGLAVFGVLLMKPARQVEPHTPVAQELENEMLAAHFGSGISVEYHSGVSSEPTGAPVENDSPSWNSEDLEMF